MPEPTHHVFEAGDFTLQSGAVLPEARLAYALHGEPSPKRDNLIVYPTMYGGTEADNRYLIGEGMALDPARYCIVVPNLLGNGVSSSPSNNPGYSRATIHDNVALQHRLVTEELGAEALVLAVGHSMGAQQAYHWASMYPAMVPRIAAICGAARTAPHTYVFLEGMRAAVTADDGLRRLGRVWAGWGLSQAWYRERLWEGLGVTLDEFLEQFWDTAFAAFDPADLIAMLETWQACDVSANDTYRGDFAAAMGAISARALVMPGQTDLYFPPEDSAAEAELLADAELHVIPSIWGHAAGGGETPADLAFLDRHLAALLAGEGSV